MTFAVRLPSQAKKENKNRKPAPNSNSSIHTGLRVTNLTISLKVHKISKIKSTRILFNQVQREYPQS